MLPRPGRKAHCLTAAQHLPSPESAKAAMNTNMSFSIDFRKAWMALKAVVVAKRLECGFGTAFACNGKASDHLVSNQNASLKTTHARGFTRLGAEPAFAVSRKPETAPSLKLPIAFKPADAHDSWTPLISYGNNESTNGARASARFLGNQASSPVNDQSRKSSRRSRVRTARRLTKSQNRYALRRLFTPGHVFEPRLP